MEKINYDWISIYFLEFGIPDLFHNIILTFNFALMEKVEQYKEIFPFIKESDIEKAIEKYKDDNLLIDHLTELNEKYEKESGVDVTLRTLFPILTIEEIKSVSRLTDSREELLALLTRKENEKKKTVFNKVNHDFTMSFIGDVLTQNDGNIDETINALSSLKIINENKDLIPIELMNDSQLRDYENVKIEDHRKMVMEEFIKLLTEDEMKKNTSRYEELKAENEICLLPIEYNSENRIVNVCWKFNEDYKFTNYEWIGLYKENTNVDNYISYVYIKNMRKSCYQFKLPKENGFYYIKLVDGVAKRILVTSLPIHVGPIVSLNAKLIENEKKITLHFKVENGKLRNRDWVSFTRKDKKHKNYLSSHYLYGYLNKEGTEGIIEVPMPRRPLEYEFRYFPYENGYEPLKISNSIKVPKYDKLNVEIVKHESSIPRQVRVTWDIYAVDISSWDYIALYKETETNYITSKYVDIKNNYLIFDLPRSPGTYYLKYWSYSIRSGPIDVSEPIIIEIKDELIVNYKDNALEVEWKIYSVDITSSDWIAIVKAHDDNNKNYICYEYIRKCSNTMVFKKVPKEKGWYEARYFSSSKPRYQHLVSSKPFYIDSK